MALLKYSKKVALYIQILGKMLISIKLPNFIEV